MSDTDISICIANYNGADILGACLASVYAQDFGGELEVLVHDDASTDGSLERELSDYPQAIVLRSTENIGYCRANHLMASAASGRFLLLLNNDVELMPGALEALYEATQMGPENIWSLPEYRMDGQLNCRGMGLDLFFTPYQCRSSKHRVVYAMGACLLIARDRWQQLGGYPEYFYYTAEDLYLCLAARSQGVPTRILDASGYRHHVSRSINPQGVDSRRRAHSERNRRFIVEHCLLPIEQAVIWPLFMSMYLAEKLYLALSRSSGSDGKLGTLNWPEGLETWRVSVLSLLSVRATKLLYLVTGK